MRARSGDSAADRLKRAEKLEALKPNNPESLLAVAQAALDTQDFARARAKAEAALRMDARESTYLLLADIEERETRDQGRIRHWLNQALRAPRDPAWVADGFVSERWLPLSPVTGRLDAFEWKRPFGQLEGPVEEGSLTAETAIASLPPLAETRPVEPPAEPRLEPAVAQTIVDVEQPKTPTLSLVRDKPASPAEPVTKPKPEAAAVSAETPKDPAADPFNGRPPDDPGVKDHEAATAPTTRLKLF